MKQATNLDCSEQPWSYSALTAFEQCPRKYYHYNLEKTVKDTGNAATEYGSMVHKAFELRLKNGKRLPLDLIHFDKYMTQLESTAGEVMTEQKLGLTRNLEATGFFDNDIWLRGIIDLVIVNNETMVVLDYKTGKRIEEGFDQVKLQAAMMFAVLPEVQKAKVGYFFTKHKKFTFTEMTRADCTEVWNEFIPRVNRMQEAIREGNFPAKQNFLCGKYCKVKTCQFCGE